MKNKLLFKLPNKNHILITLISPPAHKAIIREKRKPFVRKENIRITKQKKLLLRLKLNVNFVNISNQILISLINRLLPAMNVARKK